MKGYERKALEQWLIRDHFGKNVAGANLRQILTQVVALKKKLSGYRPLLSDDIVVAFESLL